MSIEGKIARISRSYGIRLAAVADLHHPQKPKSYREIAQAMLNASPDLVLLGGDTAHDPESLKEVLGCFNSFDGTKLAVLGNNEWRFSPYDDVDSSLEYFGSIFGEEGFKLLDQYPFTCRNLVFIGNSGFYDSELSLLNRSGIDEADIRAWQEGSRGQFRVDVSSIFSSSVRSLHNHFGLVNQDQKAVLFVHHLPSKKFLPEKPRHFKYHAVMGSVQYESFFSHRAVIDGMIGHKHSSERHIVGNVLVQNIASTVDAPFWIREY